MNYFWRQIIVIGCLGLCCAGCQSHKDDDKTAVGSVQVESQVQIKQGKDVAKPERVEIEGMAVEQAIQVDIQPVALEQFEDDSRDNLLVSPPQRFGKKQDKRRKIGVDGALLFDKDNADMVDAVQGAEVKLSVPIH